MMREAPKRVFVIHGYEGLPMHGWRPWLKGELEKKGFKVFVPAMISPHAPTMNEWVKQISLLVDKPTNRDYFVGHSLGCIAILRYFETLDETERVGGAVLVAGFSSNLGFDGFNSFYSKTIHWEKICGHCPKFVAVISDDDPYVPLVEGSIFKVNLGAELVVLPGMRHFSGDDGIIELPVVLDRLLRMSK